jgi:HPt (histidine-containing phosphotransfer) domain-containing protein
MPIVILTANAIAGMRDMFLEMGFNDYISKPIEIDKLDEVIARWVPAEKQIKAGTGIKRETFNGKTGIVIPGVDTAKGLAMTGGTEAGYRKVLAQFYKDAVERLPVFAVLPAGTGFAALATQAHALKSAAGTIGAAEVSKEAAALEVAGKAGDLKAIGEILPGFREHLARLIEEIGNALKEGREEKEAPGRKGKEAVADTLSALQAALETKNIKETDRLLEELEQTTEAEMAEQITIISDKVLMGEYEKAIELITILFAAKER